MTNKVQHILEYVPFLAMVSTKKPQFTTRILEAVIIAVLAGVMSGYVTMNLLEYRMSAIEKKVDKIYNDVYKPTLPRSSEMDPEVEREAGTFRSTIKPWIHLRWESVKDFGDGLIIKQYIEDITLHRVEKFGDGLKAYLVDITLNAKYSYDFMPTDSAIIKQRIVFKVQNSVIVDWDSLPQMRVKTLPTEIEL